MGFDKVNGKTLAYKSIGNAVSTRMSREVIECVGWGHIAFIYLKHLKQMKAVGWHCIFAYRV